MIYPYHAAKVRSWSGRRTTAGFFIAMLAIIHSNSPAPAQTNGFATAAKQAILMDAGTGAVLYQKNADELVPPASMSKLMTLAVVFKAIKAGKLSLDEDVLVSENAWRKGGAPSRTSAMMVPVGTKAKVGELIQGIVVESGNDAAIALAEHVAGSEAKFAELMTDEARAIGLKRATFKNPTGLFDPRHLMTVEELALLARHLITAYPEYYHYFGQREFSYRTYRFINRNRLLTTLDGADGLKTGQLQISGAGVVGSAKRGERRLIGVVHGLADGTKRDEEARKLMNWGFDGFGEVALTEAGDTIGYARVWGGSKVYVALGGASTGQGSGEVRISLPKFPPSPRLKGEIVYDFPLKPPVRKGDQVATLKVTTAGGVEGQVPLYAQEDVEASGIIWRGLDSAMMLALRYVPL